MVDEKGGCCAHSLSTALSLFFFSLCPLLSKRRLHSYGVAELDSQSQKLGSSDSRGSDATAMESTLYLALNDEKEHFQNFFGDHLDHLVLHKSVKLKTDTKILRCKILYLVL